MYLSIKRLQDTVTQVSDSKIQWRKHPSGVLIAPRRGTAPKEYPPGYEASDSDPFVAVLTLPDCAHRENRLVYKQCCGTVKILHCTLYEEPTSRVKCVQCGGKN